MVTAVRRDAVVMPAGPNQHWGAPQADHCGPPRDQTSWEVPSARERVPGAASAGLQRPAAGLGGVASGPTTSAMQGRCRCPWPF